MNIREEITPVKTLMEFIKENISNGQVDDLLNDWECFLRPLLEFGALNTSPELTYLPNIATDDGVFGIIAVKGELSLDISAKFQMPFYKNKIKSEIRHSSFESLEQVYLQAMKEDRPIEYTADPMRRLLGFQEFRNSCRIVHIIGITALKDYQVRNPSK